MEAARRSKPERNTVAREAAKGGVASSPVESRRSTGHHRRYPQWSPLAVACFATRRSASCCDVAELYGWWQAGVYLDNACKANGNQSATLCRRVQAPELWRGTVRPPTPPPAGLADRRFFNFSSKGETEEDPAAHRVVKHELEPAVFAQVSALACHCLTPQHIDDRLRLLHAQAPQCLSLLTINASAAAAPSTLAC